MLQYIGLLTDAQKRAGLFVAQSDEEFIFLFYAYEGKPRLIAVFNYQVATVKEIRDKAEEFLCQLRKTRVDTNVNERPE